MRGLSIFAFVAPLVSAMQLIEPTVNSTLRMGETIRAKWTSADTDPTTFSIYLVNFVNWPPFYTQLASNVRTSAGEYQVTVPCGLDSSWGYQFNAINGTNVYVIYAQTPKFHVRSGTCTGNNAAPLPDSGDSTCERITVTAAVTSTITVFPACPSTEPSCSLANKRCAATTSTVSSQPQPTDDSNPGEEEEGEEEDSSSDSEGEDGDGEGEESDSDSDTDEDDGDADEDDVDEEGADEADQASAALSVTSLPA
ncbi:Extracellular proline-serine rich protein [Madurella fahalii]|uniref:Extracellular proline-serine rich protein n=1 Tax=Madurella fahalii TaxID=1157608 RepID=A0ABQ0FYP7_9PEZI